MEGFWARQGHCGPCLHAVVHLLQALRVIRPQLRGDAACAVEAAVEGAAHVLWALRDVALARPRLARAALS
eukprot:9744611-Alexandrium_andersonii.AAC.1